MTNLHNYKIKKEIKTKNSHKYYIHLFHSKILKKLVSLKKKKKIMM